MIAGRASSAQRIRTTGFAAYARIGRCAALGDGAGVLAALDELDEPAERILLTLRRHHIAELAIHACAGDARSAAAATEMRAVLHRVRRLAPVEPRVLLEAFGEAQSAFERAGVPVLLLKGAVLAERLYGGLDRRPQHDIDVLVPHRALRPARRVLIGLGYESSRRDQHAVTLLRGPVKVDLHWALRSAPAYAIEEEAVWKDAVRVTFGNLETRTLSDDHLVTLLAVSAVEDAGLGMAKLKQLCDLWLLARQIDAEFDWDEWFRGRGPEGLEAVVVNGCALALAALDTAEEAPNLHACLAGRAKKVRIRDREHALSLLAAPREAGANKAWFADVYPGSVLAYRAHSFLAGFPASIRDTGPGRHLRRVPVRPQG